MAEHAIPPRFNLSSRTPGGPTRRLLSGFQLFKHSKGVQSRAELSDIRYDNTSPISVEGTVTYVPTRSMVTPCLTRTQCEIIMSKLEKTDTEGFFHFPVDAEALGLLDYHLIVKRPMDFSTISKKLSSGEYDVPNDENTSLVSAAFFHDVDQIWTNAYSFNKPLSPVSILATKLEAQFGGLVSEQQKQYKPINVCTNTG